MDVMTPPRKFRDRVGQMQTGEIAVYRVSWTLLALAAVLFTVNSIALGGMYLAVGVLADALAGFELYLISLTVWKPERA